MQSIKEIIKAKIQQRFVLTYLFCFDTAIVIIPKNATTIPIIYIVVSEMPVKIQIKMLPKTELKLIIAETGPVGPSLRALTTKSSAITPHTPADNPVSIVYLSKYRLIGTRITLNAESKMTNIAHIKSAMKPYLRKVGQESIRVQYFVIFIRVESKSIEINELINIIFSALFSLSSNSEVWICLLFENTLERLIVKMPAKQISEPAMWNLVNFSLYIKKLPSRHIGTVQFDIVVTTDRS